MYRFIWTLLIATFFINPIIVSADQNLAPNYVPNRAAYEGITPVNPSEFDGSFRYSIPIETPPGRNGMEPGLTLEYSSNTKKNVNAFGHGWNSNIPYIERINKTGTNNLYTDHSFFSTLDGEATTTDAGMVNFGPLVENGDFRQYEWVDGDYWKVTDKTGTVYTFGTASTSQIVHTASSTMVYRWMLEEVRDLNDNYISYDYYKDEGFIYPSTIKYTGNDTTDGAFEVAFLRETRSDIASSSALGYWIASEERIDEIQVKVDGSWVRKYDIAYTTGDNGDRSLISSITETGKDENGATVAYPATSFTYNTSTDSWTYDSSWVMPDWFVDYDAVSQNRRDNGIRFSDFDGDGLVDIAHILNAESEIHNIYFNNGDGTWATTTVGTLQGLSFVRRYGDDLGYRVVDIDGDGLVDVHRPSAVPLKNTGRGTVFTADSTYSNPVTFTKCYDYPSGCYWQGATFMELNGDGLIDVLKQYDGNSPQTDDNGVYLNTGSDWVASTTFAIPYSLSRIYDSQGGVDNGIRVADMNGDGLDDLVHMQWPSGGEDNKFIYFNNGDGTWATSSPITSVGTPFVGLAGNNNHVYLADVNSDGLPDFVKVNASSGNTVFLNNDYGRSFTLDSSWGAMPTNFRCTGSPYCAPVGDDGGARFVDINGDGLVDIIKSDGTDPASEGASGAYLHDGVEPDILKSITTKLGETITISYTKTGKPTSSGDTLNDDLPHNLTIVSDVVRDDGFGTVGTTTFTFEDGHYYYNDEFDRRFAGFASTTETDAFSHFTKKYFHTGSTTETALGEYSDDISKIGKQYREEKYDSSNNLYTTSVTRWENISLSNDRDFVKATTTLELHYDGDADHRDTATTFVYDDTNGNITTQTEYGEVSGNSNGSFTDSGSDKRTTTYTYAASTTLHLIGLPSKETLKNNGGTTVAEKKFYYDGLSLGNVSKGNLTKQEELESGSTYIDIERTYDGTYGLVTQEKDPRNKATNFTYDSYNVHIATSTNAKSQATDFYYDLSSGEVATTTDVNGRQFVTVFDGLDRPIAEKIPDPASPSTLVVKTDFTYTDTVGSRKVFETHHLGSATSTLLYRYLDGMDRIVQERTEMEDVNTYAVTDTGYDERGDVATTTLPYKGTGSARTSITTNSDLITAYTYDALQRPKTMVNATGTESYAYDQWWATTTDRKSNTKALNFDVYGNLAGVNEVNSSSTYVTTYQYDVLNNLTKITDALANVRNFTYDGLSRLTKSEDIHDVSDTIFASTTYTHDDSGNITSRLDQKNQTVNFTYDDINRVLTEDYTGSGGTEISYGYDWCAEGVGRLCNATTTDVTTKHEYNALGLNTKEIREIGADTYTTTFTYDRQGNKTSVTYPDGSDTLYQYNLAGLLERILYKEVGTTTYDMIVSDYNYHASGQVEYAMFANNIESNYTYGTTTEYRIENIDTRDADGPLQEGNNPYSTHLVAASTQYFATSSPSGLPTGNSSRTIEAWVKFDSLPGADTEMFLVDMGDQTTDEEFGLSFIKSGSSYVGYLDTYGAAVTGAVDLGFALDTWYHYAATYDGTDVRWYVNGVLKETKAVGRTLSTGSGVVEIGRRIVGTRYVDGSIDDVRIWDDVRTATEIFDNKSREVDDTEANLAGYWRFNNDAVDTTANGNDLTAHNSPTFTTDVPFSSWTISMIDESFGNSLAVVESSVFNRFATYTLNLIFGTPQVAYAKDKPYTLHTQKAVKDKKGNHTSFHIGTDITIDEKELEQLTKKGWNYTSMPINVYVYEETGEVRASTLETTFHNKWIHYKTLDGWKDINTNFVLSEGGSCFEMTEAPFEVCAPLTSGGTATMLNNNRWDVFKNQEMKDSQQTMEIQALGTHNVAGRIVQGSLEVVTGTQEDVSYVLYEGAYNNADLIYYVDFGEAPRLEKLVRFNGAPQGYEYPFKYSFEYPVKIRQKDKTEKYHLFNRASSTPALKKSRGFSVQTSSYISRESMRGFGFKELLIWDSGQEYLTPNGQRNIRPVDYSIEELDRFSYILTKDVEDYFVNNSGIVYPVFTDTVTTFYPDADTESTSVDGYVFADPVAVAWDTMRNGLETDSRTFSADDTTNTSNALFIREKENDATGWKSMSRSIFLFDTSVLGTDTVDSATLSIYNGTRNSQGTFTDPSAGITDSNPADNTVLVKGDYSASIYNDVDFATRKTWSSITDSAYMDFALNAAGTDNITSSISKFALRWGGDIDDTEPTATPDAYRGVDLHFSEATGTTTDPKLVVTHTATNQTPTAPTSMLTEGQTNPVNLYDTRPEFSAIYNDPDTSDSATDYQVQVSTSTDFAPIYWDSSKTVLLSPITEGNRSEDISYGGDTLATSTTYYWRVKFWDEPTSAGAWSTATSSFSIAPDAPPLQEVTFTYDKVGNIINIIDGSYTDAQKILTFTYDDLSRILIASTTVASTTPFSRTYAYNAIGNITNKSDQGAYTYSETNYTNPHAVTGIAGTSYTYDNVGNVTDAGSWDYAWDYRNRMTQADTGAATTTYEYDHTNIRTKKTVDGTVTTYANAYYNIKGATTTKHILGPNGELIATIEGNGSATTTNYIHTDHLGGTNVVTDQSGNKVQTLDYYPFGEKRVNTKTGDFDEQNKFTGHEHDGDTDLTYAKQRYYGQDYGRFLSIDPVAERIVQPEELLETIGWSQQNLLGYPQLLNTYSYTANNPVNLTDPEGEIIPAILFLYGVASLAVDVFDLKTVAYDYPDQFSDEDKRNAMIKVGLDIGLPALGRIGTAAERTALELFSTTFDVLDHFWGENIVNQAQSNNALPSTVTQGGVTYTRNSSGLLNAPDSSDSTEDN